MQTEICAQKLVGHRNEKQNHRNVSAERSSLSSFKHILHAAQGQPHYWKETRWTDLISHSCSYSKCGVSLETEIERSQLNALGYFCRRAVYSSIFTTFGGYSSIGGVAHVHRPDTSLWRHPGWAPQRTTLITYGCRLRESLSKERQRRFSACQQQKKKKKKAARAGWSIWKITAASQLLLPATRDESSPVAAATAAFLLHCWSVLAVPRSPGSRSCTDNATKAQKLPKKSIYISNVLVLGFKKGEMRLGAEGQG